MLCLVFPRRSVYAVRTALFLRYLEMKVHHLWEFIRELLDIGELQQQDLLRGCAPPAPAREACPVIWESKENGVFRIVNSKLMAKLWGDHKRNSTMTYEKLSRSLR